MASPFPSWSRPLRRYIGAISLLMHLAACGLNTFGQTGDASSTGSSMHSSSEVTTHDSTSVDATTSGASTMGLSTTSVLGTTGTTGTTAIDSSTTAPPGPTCNNGLLEDDEKCDDGNDDPFDGCTPSCQPTRAIGLGIGPISYNTCALLPNGGARCWGLNTQGQLGSIEAENIGDDEPASYLNPLGAPGVNGTRFRALAGGERHTCALTTEDKVFCWGSRIEGRTGDGQFADCVQPNLCDSDFANDSLVPFGSLGPTEHVEFGIVNPTQLAVGNGHACSTTEDGKLYCWGLNNHGQLGLGHTTCVGTTCKPTLTPVSFGVVPGQIVQIAAGGAHTCVRFDAPADNVMCWGLGSTGQLGRGNVEKVGDGVGPSLVAVSALTLGEAAIDLAAGNQFTCVVLESGAVRCWGDNPHGQLGQGDIKPRGDTPATTPEKIPNIALDRPVRKIRCGNDHVCALTVDGAVKCWGYGKYGALGYGDSNDVGNAPENPADAGDVDVGGLVLDIGVGEQHTCALLDTTEIRCWGAANSGQLGYGNNENIGDEPGETPASAGDVPF